jgi:hypothetical protein
LRAAKKLRKGNKRSSKLTKHGGKKHGKPGKLSGKDRSAKLTPAQLAKLLNALKNLLGKISNGQVAGAVQCMCDGEAPSAEDMDCVNDYLDDADCPLDDYEKDCLRTAMQVYSQDDPNQGDNQEWDNTNDNDEGMGAGGRGHVVNDDDDDAPQPAGHRIRIHRGAGGR